MIGKNIAKITSAVVGFVFFAVAQSAYAEAPFGDKVSSALKNYNRASPMVGSAGILGEGGVTDAKALGFKSIIDLRTPKEGVARESALAAKVGIRHISIPVSTLTPSSDQVREFGRQITDQTNLPALVHCVSGNRVGAMWALFRAQNGVPAKVAVEEGQTLGLRTRRLRAVKKRLGLAE